MESEEAIQGDKLGDLQNALMIVEGVLNYIHEEELGPTDSVLHIMTHSVDVQRVATLSQLRDYLSPLIEERTRLFQSLLSDVTGHKEDVQVACAKGVESIIHELKEEEKPRVFHHMHLNLFKIQSSAMTAWKTCYFNLVATLDEETILFFVIPLALNLSKDEVNAKRGVAVQLLSKAIQTVPMAASDTAVIQCISSLTADKASTVRTQLANEFSHFCTRNQHAALIQERLMIPLMRLLLDEDVRVSCGAFKTLVQLSETLDESFLASFVQPILLQYVQGCPATVQEVVVAEFGRLLWNFKECLRHENRTDAEFLLGIYLTLSGSADEQFRRECAFNFPAVVATYDEPLQRRRLEPFLRSLSADNSPKVRICMAAGFHELCLLFADSDNAHELLRPSFMKLLSDTSQEVRERLVKHIEKIFTSISAKMPDAERVTFFAACAPLLVAYERDIQTNWRKVEALLNPFRFFPNWFSAKQLHTLFVPVLIRHLQSGAASLKPTVCSTLALFLRTFDSDAEKVISIKSVRKLALDVGQSKSAAGRIAYVDLCEQMLPRFSVSFFRTYLLGTLVNLQKDSVSNVRLRLAKSLRSLRAVSPMLDIIDQHLTNPLLADPDQDVSAAAMTAMTPNSIVPSGKPVAALSGTSLSWSKMLDVELEEAEGSISSPRLLDLVAKSEAADKQALAEAAKRGGKGRPGTDHIGRPDMKLNLGGGKPGKSDTTSESPNSARSARGKK